MENGQKVRENRLRRMAKRQGLALSASGRRDPRAIDYGAYALFDAERHFEVAGVDGTGRFEFSLDDVEKYLTGGRR